MRKPGLHIKLKREQEALLLSLWQGVKRQAFRGRPREDEDLRFTANLYLTC